MTSPKITLYQHANYRGDSKTFTESCPNLLDKGFDNRTTSVKVEGGVWVLYQFKDYSGKIYVCEEGDEIPKVKDFNEKTSSLKLLDDFDFSEEPRCTVYDRENYRGRSLTFDDDVDNLKDYRFNNKVSSIRVHSGAWVGYQYKNYGGQQWLFLKGNYNDADGHFKDNAISSMGKIHVVPKLPVTIESIDFDLGRASIRTTPRAVFSWTQTNDTSVEQELSVSNEQSITTSNTYEFNWSHSTKVSASMKASLKIPVIDVGAEMSLSTETTVNVGSKRGYGTSETNKWKIDFPSKIPRWTRIVLTSSITEGKSNVPYVAILSQGDRSWTERGTFSGVQFYNFHTEFQETPLD